MVSPDQAEVIEFNWGKKKGKGGRKMDVQFYESFTWDGVDYCLYDAVYMFDETEVEPDIGILIKIWELPDGSKKVKTLWFFRPCEISKFIGDAKFSRNELLLASGEGVGLTNINPLEAIAGKCNVVCALRDGQIPVLSNNELQGADFVFYRTFDVGHNTILEHVKGKIAGIDVKLLFSRMHTPESCSIKKLDSNDKGLKEKSLVINKTNKIDTHEIDVAAHWTKAPMNQLDDGDKLVVTTPNKTNGSGGFETTTTSIKDNVVNKEPRHQLGSDKLQQPTSTLDVDKVQHRKQPSMANDSISLKSKDKISPRSIENCSVANRDKVGKVHFDKALIEAKGKASGDENIEYLCRGDTKVTTQRTKRERDSLGCDSVLSKKLKLGEKSSPCNTSKPSIEPTSRRDPNLGSNSQSSELATKPKLDDKPFTKDGHKASKPHLEQGSNKGQDLGNNLRRQEVDKSKWFKLPWDERLRMEHERGKVVFLQNLDPSFNSTEVEGIIQKAFKLSCVAKMILRTSFSSPNYGQAFAIFNTRQAAEMVVTKLEKGCLMLPNGRPLVGTFANPCLPTTSTTFCGHLVIDRPKHQMQREMKDAVSTSHCSQPNTIEFDLAIEWRLLAERSDREWKSLHKLQGNELRNIKAALKSK